MKSITGNDEIKSGGNRFGSVKRIFKSMNIMAILVCIAFTANELRLAFSGNVIVMNPVFIVSSSSSNEDNTGRKQLSVEQVLKTGMLEISSSDKDNSVRGSNVSSSSSSEPTLETLPEKPIVMEATKLTTQPARNSITTVLPEGSAEKEAEAPPERIPIMELLHPTINKKHESSRACPEGSVYVDDVHRPRNITHSGRKIPRIIHVTSKSRCMTKEFAENLDSWRFENYSFYFHDDAAVQRLLDLDWSHQFPHLDDAKHCLTSGAALADVWRYLALWEYGGIYTDVDNKRIKFHGETISPQDDSYFLREGNGMMSQWFIASSRHHPLMNYSINDACTALLTRNKNVMNVLPAQLTGPHAIKVGYMWFMQDGPHGGPLVDRNFVSMGYDKPGVYVGYQNRSVTISGASKAVIPGGVGTKSKSDGYSKMNMTHFLDISKDDVKAIDSNGRKVSCKKHAENVRKLPKGSSTKPQDMYTIAYKGHNKQGAPPPNNGIKGGESKQATKATDPEVPNKELTKESKAHSHVSERVEAAPERIPIMELLHPIHERNKTISRECPEGMVYVDDIHRPRNITHAGRKIPRIVHVTSKSRCMTKEFADNLDSWRFQSYSFYFHDDDAVHRLLNLDWSHQFPRLNDAKHCLTSGAALADVWRYLALWEYGGIYTDVDNKRINFNGETILPEDDSYFLREGAGMMSQWFLATSRHHPLMNYSINDACTALLTRNKNVMNVLPAQLTGPHAIKVGYMWFIQDGPNGGPLVDRNFATFGYDEPGVYVGYQNRSVTISGERKHVIPGGVGSKSDGYSKMNMTHFLQISKKNVKAVDSQGRGVSCKRHVENIRKLPNGSSTKPQDMYTILSK